MFMTEKLFIQLTPPRPKDRLATMAPQEWLQQPELRDSLKRNASYVEINSERQKQLKLGSRKLDCDQSIWSYHRRTEPFHQARDRICVTLDVNITLDETKQLRERMQKEANVCMANPIIIFGMANVLDRRILV